MVTQKTLLERLRYDEKLGKFFWIKHRLDCFIGIEAGSLVNTKTKHPRVMLTIGDDRIYRARAAYIYVNGDLDPKILIDHKNGDTTDDRIQNLRIASAIQNTWNRIRSQNPGVSKDSRGRFKTRIQIGKKKVNLGTWDTEAEAKACYLGASAIIHGEFSTLFREKLA